MPTPDQDSGSVRMVGIMQILLQLRCKVTFFADNLMPVEPYTSELQKMGI